MDAASIRELNPYVFLELTSGVTDQQVQLLCTKQHGGVYLLPTNATTTDKLKAYLDMGASIVLEHSDIRTHTLSSTDRDALIDHGQENVFLKGYSDGHCLRFLQQGASLLIDGVDKNLTPATIQQLCGMPHQGHIRVLANGFSKGNRRDLLRRDISIIYSKADGQEVLPPEELLADVAVGKEHVVMHVSDWPLAQTLEALQAGAKVLVTGCTRWDRNAVEEHLIHPANTQERTRIELLLRYGPAGKINAFRQMGIIFQLEEVDAEVMFN